MSNGILGTAVSGLMAFQRSLETTSHNITNANTEGYSRQRVEAVTTSPQYTGGGYVGTGVQVANISRSYDQFISGQLRSSTSTFGEVDSFKSYASQIDNLLADPATGMDPAIQSFFNSVNDVANDPSSIAAREVMLMEGESLTHRFGMISNQFYELKDQVNSDLKSMTETASSYAEGVADLNLRISSAIAKSNGMQQPNDLMDKRDLLLNKLAELVDVSVIPQDNGMVSVLMSNGLPLVLDNQAVSLGTQSNEFDPTRLEVIYNDIKGNEQLVTDRINGGKIAGTLRFREEILDPAQQKLGAVAAAIALEFNAVHENGYDLDGVLGGAFFKFNGVEVPVNNSPSNLGTGVVTSGFNNINTNPTGASSADLEASDFLLAYNDPLGSGYTLTRLRDDNVINLTLSGGVLTPTSGAEKLPGITLAIAGVAQDGDQFLIRPTYHAADKLEMNITDSRKIAAATNIDENGVLIGGPMPGDNRNVLSLAALANNSGMFGGTASFQESYGQIVSKVGGLAHAANISAEAQQSLLNRATEARENIAGVNLDEEAANLIKFQQSYQAAAQAISTASTLFDTLIGAVR